jgi:hypothetical protein
LMFRQQAAARVEQHRRLGNRYGNRPCGGPCGFS